MEIGDIATLIFLGFTGFMAAFIDSMVGGGGLISIPALMWTGIPLVEVLGTNKMAAVMGATSSFLVFLRSGKMDVWLIKRLFPLSLIGSAAGVLLVRSIPPDFLRPLVVALLIAVTLYSIFKKDWGMEAAYKGMTRRLLLLSGCIAFAFGMYDGFFGPGTGSFLLFAFLCAGFDYLGAAANAKALNFASNIAAALLFAYFGEVNYAYALPMGFVMILGAWCGTKVALKKGTKYVRPIFIAMTTALIGKQLWDLLH